MERTILKTVEEVTQWFSTRKDVMSWDWETTGLSSVSMKPVGISFCDGERSCYIDLWENPDAGQILELLSGEFLRGLWIAHNIKFDLLCNRSFGLQLPSSIFCTLTAAQLIDENRESLSLKSLVVDELGVNPAEVVKWEKSSQTGYHSKEWYKYCFNDAEWCFALYQKYVPELKKQKLDYLFNEVEMPFQFALVELEYNGVHVDTVKLRQLEESVIKNLQAIEDQMLEICGKTATIQRLLDGTVERVLPINLNSSKQLINIIEDICHLEITEKTKTGEKSCGKETIKRLLGKHRFIDLLADYKKYTKLYNAYVVPAFDLIESDGRVHPSYHTVRTGRLSCSDPNLQQLPNVDKDKPEINYRRIFTAETGNVLVGGDYSGQELRILGAVTNDKVIIGEFQKNHDLHLVTASAIFNLDLTTNQITEGTTVHEETKKKFKLERYRAKNGVNFPIIYGTTPTGISKRQGVSKEEATDWIRKFFQLYPNVKKSMLATERELENLGYVTTLFGRKRRFPLFKHLTPREKARCVRQAFNFKIQGLAADQVKLALGRLTKSEQVSMKLVLTVHDEIVVECRKEQAETVKSVLESTMKNIVDLGVPFDVDVKIAESYDLLK